MSSIQCLGPDTECGPAERQGPPGPSWCLLQAGDWQGVGMNVTASDGQVNPV